MIIFESSMADTDLPAWVGALRGSSPAERTALDVALHRHSASAAQGRVEFVAVVGILVPSSKNVLQMRKGYFCWLIKKL